MKSSIKRNLLVLSAMMFVISVLMTSCPGSTASNIKLSPEFLAKRDVYMDVVRAAGFQPSLYVSNDIVFTQENGRQSFVVIDRRDSDSSLVYVNFNNIIPVNSQNMEKAAFAINEANMTTKVARACFHPDANGNVLVVVVSETALENPNDFSAVFPRLLATANTLTDKIVSAMN